MIWIILPAGVLAWIWLIWQVSRRDGYFDRRPCTCRKGARCLACMDADGMTKPKGSS